MYGSYVPNDVCTENGDVDIWTGGDIAARRGTRSA